MITPILKAKSQAPSSEDPIGPETGIEIGIATAAVRNHVIRGRGKPGTSVRVGHDRVTAEGSVLKVNNASAGRRSRSPRLR